MRSVQESQQGYIFRSILLFALIMTIALLFFFPDKYKNNFLGCQVGEAPSEEEQKEKKVLPEIHGVNEGSEGIGGHEPFTSTNYILIRKNVPMLVESDSSIFTNKTYSHTVLLEAIPYPGFRVFYPGKYGEVDFYREFKASYGNSYGADPIRQNNQFRFRQESILYLVHADEKGNPIIEISDEGVKTYLVDFYQDERRFLDKSKNYTAEEIFYCSQTSIGQQYEFLSPTPFVESKEKKELQLNWFLIKGGIWNAHCKPAIYLYPEKETRVSLRVETKGELLYTDPIYPKSGWEVIASPDGSIKALGKTHDSNGFFSATGVYPYLYYESRLPEKLVPKPATGFVYAYEHVFSSLETLLPRLGLSSTQTADFISYWQKTLPKSPYYFIGVVSEETINAAEPLQISPAPDVVRRVRIYFEALKESKTITEPDLSLFTSFEKNGFTVIEWGGLIKTDPNHPFLCSQ